MIVVIIGVAILVISVIGGVLLNVGNRPYWYYVCKDCKHEATQYKSSGFMGQIVIFPVDWFPGDFSTLLSIDNATA
ncbi:MAG: hypothetical protein PVH54_02265 [Gammaproteobacteria bacterium]|jgi:hypothetical protein